MNDKLDLILSELQQLNGKVSNLETKMGGLESRMGGLESRMGGLESRMGGLEINMGGLESRVITIEANMATKKDVAELPFIHQAVMETSEKVEQILHEQKSLHEMYGAHEVAIRTLRRNPESIYEESEAIAYLKASMKNKKNNL